MHCDRIGEGSVGDAFEDDEPVDEVVPEDDDEFEGYGGDSGERCLLLDRICSAKERFGWATYLEPATATLPAHAYTIGLAELGAPELIVLGLPPGPAHDVLTTIAGRVRDGARFQHGQVLDDVRPPHRHLLLEVADGARYLREAAALVPFGSDGRRSLRAWQVVPSDGAGRWPWHPGSEAPTPPLLGPVPEGV
jgi:Domain of unknown function (DUF4262)